MSDMSNYLKGAIADYFFRPAAAVPARPNSLRMSLWSAVTNPDDGTGTEFTSATAPGYARATISFGAVALPGGVLASSTTTVFPTATANWPTATHYGIHDQSGNLLQSLKVLTQSQLVLSGDHAEAPAGSITITLS